MLQPELLMFLLSLQGEVDVSHLLTTTGGSFIADSKSCVTPACTWSSNVDRLLWPCRVPACLVKVFGACWGGGLPGV